MCPLHPENASHHTHINNNSSNYRIFAKLICEDSINYRILVQQRVEITTVFLEMCKHRHWQRAMVLFWLINQEREREREIEREREREREREQGLYNKNLLLCSSTDFRSASRLIRGEGSIWRRGFTLAGRAVFTGGFWFVLGVSPRHKIWFNHLINYSINYYQLLLLLLLVVVVLLLLLLLSFQTKDHKRHFPSNWS